MLSITSAWIPSTFTAFFTTTKSPAVSRKSSNSERKSRSTAVTFHPTNIISAPLSSTRLIVKPQTQPLLAPLVGPMTVAEYYEDEEEDTSEEIVGEKMEEKETSSAEKETSISVRSSSSQEVTTITRAPFVSITTAYPSLFTPAAPSSELSPLLLTNTPRLPFALLSRSSPPQHHRRPAFHYDALHHSTSNPLPIEQESEHYLPGFADLSSLRRVSPDAEPKSSRFSKRRREQMRAKSRKEGMLRRDTVVKQADMIRRRREQERREREEEEKERAVDLLLSLAWRV